ncbi:MAG: hypothetical protein ACOYBY_15065 [Dermatophilaceae bacterium]
MILARCTGWSTGPAASRLATWCRTVFGSTPANPAAKVSPVVGRAVIAQGMFLLSLVGADTRCWQFAVAISWCWVPGSA